MAETATSPDPERELARLRAASALDRAADEALEVATRDRLPLRAAIASLLPILAEHTGADAAWVRTWDENLELSDFAWPDADRLGFRPDDIDERVSPDDALVERGTAGAVVAQALDVAGDRFGTAALRVAGAVDEARADELAQLLEVWCEELDNFLAAIARARRKHVITRALSDALKHPVLENGISEALKALDDEVHFDDLLLVYRHEEDIEGKSLNYRVIKEGKLLHDSLAQTGLLVDDELRGRLLEMLLGEDTTVPQHFGIRGYREEVLINGIREQHVVGRVLVARRSGEFNTFDRDLLERFADYLRQRIVDYNHQWKVLSLTFPRDVVVRLLSEEGYAERYLAPRERDVAILYCDISGFTRLSEQVLGEPALIGELVDTWSARAVDLVWQNGGAFDKMVGDCIIGLWGPPFFEWTPAETCARAARAALAIRDYSRTLSTVLPSLRDVDFPVGVATGLNYCPLFVGRFGPNEDFTGFSSGMNNTARLQGVASRDEILCMDRFVATLNAPERFGPEAQAAVKNVAEPLVYRGLLS